LESEKTRQVSYLKSQMSLELKSLQAIRVVPQKVLHSGMLQKSSQSGKYSIDYTYDIYTQFLIGSASSSTNGENGNIGRE